MPGLRRRGVRLSWGVFLRFRVTYFFLGMCQVEELTVVCAQLKEEKNAAVSAVEKRWR